MIVIVIVSDDDVRQIFSNRIVSSNIFHVLVESLEVLPSKVRLVSEENKMVQGDQTKPGVVKFGE